MDAPDAASAPGGETDRRRARERLFTGPLLTLAVGVCAALPVIVAAGRALHEGFQPVADRGIIATRAFDVFSAHTPLVGQYSFAGAVTGKLTYSLGPMLYWLLAPAAHIGAPQTLVLTMAVVNVASVLGAVALARRRGGAWLMLAAAIAIALMCRSIAANNFYDIWNPSAGLFPLLALIFVCWSLACGDYRLLPPAVLLGSFELQCEDAFIPPALGALVVGLIGFGLWWRNGRRAETATRPPTVWRWALAAAVVGALCWTPTVIDQLAHSGNLGKVIEAASERRSPLGPTVGVHAVIRTVGITPWWLTRVGYPFQRKYDVRQSQGAFASVSAALMLTWLLLAVALAIRRRRTSEAVGAVLALVLCGAVWSVADATPSTPHFLAETLGYTLWSATTVGMFAWLLTLRTIVVLGGVDRLLARAWAARAARARARPRRAAIAAASLGAVVLAAGAGAAGAATGTPDEHAFEFHALGVINAHLGAVPRGHSVFLNARLDGLITPLRPEMTYELRRRGVRALGNGAYLRTGHWYELSEHPYDYIVWVYDDNRLPVKGARVIAVAHIRTLGRVHTVTVALSHAQAHARGATPQPRAASDVQTAAPATTFAALTATPAARAAANPGRPVRVAPIDWSLPASLAGCAAAGPRVAFPSEGPFDATGPGAIAWVGDDRACAHGTATAVPAPALVVARAGPGTRVLAPRGVSLAFNAAPQLSAAGASFGRLAFALTPAGARTAEESTVLQGRADGVIRPAVRGSSTLAIARAYLGDVAVATLQPHAISVRVQRWFGHDFGAPRTVAIPAGQVSALTVTLDYRSDVLLAWEQNGSIYAHMLRASGVPEPTQRVAPSAPEPQLRALVSDNDHGMLAWSSTAGSGAAARTHVELAFSGPRVRFLKPTPLAAFADPFEAGRAAGSIELVRLSTENVLLAWTVRAAGRYVVRAAPAVFAARRPSALLSAPAGNAVLEDLATGPAGEAVALWRAAASTQALAARPQLWSSRVILAPGDRPVASVSRAVGPARALTQASVAVDPASDRPLAAWRTAGPQPRIEFATGGGAGGYRPRALAALAPPHAGSSHWLRFTLVATAIALVLAALAAVALRRRSSRRARRA